MFETAGPRVFALPPGAAFARRLAEGLRARTPADAPEMLGRATLFLNSARMLRAVREAFAELAPGFVPRLRIVTEAADDPALGLGPAPPRLRRHLELVRLIEGLAVRDPALAPTAAVQDLAATLADLLDELEGEAVPPERLAGLDVAEHAAHWARTQTFLGIVAPLYHGAGAGSDGRLRLAAERLAARWAAAPPAGPVIVAGSTGSRGATVALMRAVAELPQGAIVLPGFDFDMPPEAWAALDDAATAEDHPQYRFVRLLGPLGLGPADVRAWDNAPPPDPARNRVVSLALRPAPVTDRWRVEGPQLPPLPAAMAGVTLIEAPSPRAEALAIALALRETAATGATAALVTPDRGLARQVAAALDRWGIVPDDSGGLPLGLSAPGRFLRLVAGLTAAPPTVEALLALLKHPLAASGGARGPHLLHTRALERHLRRHGPAFPTAATLADWGRDGATAWAQWVAGVLSSADALCAKGAIPLAAAVAAHLGLAERIAAGPEASGPGALWQEAAGAEAAAAMATLRAEAAGGGAVTPSAYADLLAQILGEREVREAAVPDPRVRILGTIEARVLEARRVILGGLNEGAWPAALAPDPWLSRAMRAEAGLLLPERRIGLAAHDFQIAAAAPEVILSRALRDSEAETTPARWLNRLSNLLAGLPERDGPAALAAMRARGSVWLAAAAALDRPVAPVPREARPAPRPPVAARPRRLSVTQISTLIRDPYAIYARMILGLSPMDPIRAAPDARLRGSVLHRVLETFARERPEGESRATAGARLAATARAVLEALVPWPAQRILWAARLERAADFLLEFDAALGGTPVLLEEGGQIDLPGLGFTLTARPDRIDLLPDGRLHIIDYKTGTPPSRKQIRHFDKQLVLEALIARAGGFAPLGPRPVARASYLGLGATPSRETIETDAALLDEAEAGLATLIARYADRAQSYASRRAVADVKQAGDYDHLARFGEWSQADDPVPADVGGSEP